MKQTFPQVYLVRHGETACSISGQHAGRTDIALTEQRQPACLERHGRKAAVGVELFVRACIAGIRAPGLARRGREQVGCAANAIKASALK